MPGPNPRIPADVHWRRFDSELVVLDLRRGEYYAFSQVAADVFEGIARGQALQEIERALLEAYDVKPEALHDDVYRLVGDLLEQGLLEADPT